MRLTVSALLTLQTQATPFSHMHETHRLCATHSADASLWVTEAAVGIALTGSDMANSIFWHLEVLVGIWAYTVIAWCWVLVNQNTEEEQT